MMRYTLIILFASTIFCSTDVEVVQEDNVKIVQAGEDVKLTCTFSTDLLTTTWFKQTADRKSVQIVSSYLDQKPIWNNNFENQFNVIKEYGCFNLTILKTKPSDSATYFCLCISPYTSGMGSGTRLLVKDAAADRNTTLQQSLIDTVHPGASVNLQCSIFTESCAGYQSVYWFKQSSADSEGVLYTKAERNGRCKNSTESQRHSCVYSLHKSNISHSDTGIYYCAVVACGEILFGRGTELIITASAHVTPALLALGILNIIFFIYAVCVTIKLCDKDTIHTSQVNQGEDILSYAAQIDLIAEGLKVKTAEEYSVVKYSMFTQKPPIKRFRP